MAPNDDQTRTDLFTASIRAYLLGASALALGFLTLLSGCILSMDAFEPWEAYYPEFVNNVPRHIAADFPDETAMLGYALATDCFVSIEPKSDRDLAIQTSCEMEDGTIFSDHMSLPDLCDHWTDRHEGKVLDRKDVCP